MARGLALTERLLEPLLADVPPPGADPFYRPPDDVASHEPGSLLAARPVEVRALVRRLRVRAWQLQYRSTDTRGDAVTGVATVMVPSRPYRHGRRPLLSYQCAIDSLGAAADPSFTLRRGNQKELALMALALRRGWAIVTADYTGPRRAYAAGLIAGRFVLDAIRAAVRFDADGVDGSTPVGLWGYSGGAQATAWAAEQHAGYAPELNIVGSAAGGVPADLVSSIPRFDGSIFSGLGVGACVGLSREFPDIDLHAGITPEGRRLMESAVDMTVEQIAAHFPFVRWRDYLTVPEVLDIPGLRAAFEANALGQATPVAPVYLYHAIRDQLLAIEEVDALVARYRAEGAAVEYRRFRFGEHVIVAVTGVPSALRFLAARFRAAERLQIDGVRDIGVVLHEPESLVQPDGG